VPWSSGRRSRSCRFVKKKPALLMEGGFLAFVSRGINAIACLTRSHALYCFAPSREKTFAPTRTSLQKRKRMSHAKPRRREERDAMEICGRWRECIGPVVLPLELKFPGILPRCCSSSRGATPARTRATSVGRLGFAPLTPTYGATGFSESTQENISREAVFSIPSRLRVFA